MGSADDIAVLAKRKAWLTERVAAAAKTGRRLTYDELECETLGRVIQQLQERPATPRVEIIRVRL